MNTSVTSERARVRLQDVSQSRRARHRLDWPLTIVLAGFPLWWVLGLTTLMPLAMTIPMAARLWARQKIHLPRSMGWWLLLLLWVVISVFALEADAPGAVPGGGPERFLVFAYRLGWYFSCTVVFLWVGNAREEALPSLRVVRLLAWMFVVTVAGGLLGMAVPRLEFTSLMEALLPHSLTASNFIQSIVHPAAANLTTFLGHEEYRPVAPFAFANSWGSNLSMFLPFFLMACFGKNAGWLRILGPIVLAASVAPIVYSMNRGLWASLGAGALLLLVYFVLRGRMRSLLAVGIAVGIAAIVFGLSPLADVTSERLDNAHSNERRGQLLSQTVASTVEGSPIIGFGSTRDVQGSFASIAGGGTPDCPACEVPPLGTQGHLWLVIFSQGLVGASFFLLFFIGQLRSRWRCRTPLELVSVTLLIFLALQMFIYDTLGMPLYTVMIGLALAWREQRNRRTYNGADWELGKLLASGNRYIGLFLVLSLTGGGVSAVLLAARAPVYAGHTSLLLTPSPVYLSDEGGTSSARTFTVDTEAALVLSENTLKPIGDRMAITDPSELRSRIQITAAPNTSVLQLTYFDRDRQRATFVVDELARAYLNARTTALAQRRSQVLRDLQDQLTNRITSGLGTATEDGTAVEASDELRTSIVELTAIRTDPGEVIRSGRVTKENDHPQVVVASAAGLGFLLGLAIAIAHAVLQRKSTDLPSHHKFRPVLSGTSRLKL